MATRIEADETQQVVRAWEAKLLRASHPVAWPIGQLARKFDPDICAVPGLGYVVSGASLLRTILLDGERFRKDGASSVATVITQVFGPTALANMEGDAHAHLRQTLKEAFLPRQSDALLHSVADPAVAGMTRRLTAGDSVDLAAEARVLTATTINALAVSGSSRILSRSAALRLHSISTSLAASLSARIRPLNRSELKRASALHDELIDAIGPFDVDSQETIAGRLQRAGYRESEIRSVVAMLVVAGVETTSVAIARAVALISDSRTWSRLCDDKSAIPRAIDEALRLLSPLPICTRTISSTCEINGRRLQGGRTLICHLYNAVRDERLIERGDDYDLDRPIPAELRHLWFGAGPHFCIGMSIARALVDRMIRALAAIGGVTVQSRVAARNVLIPSYAELRIAADVSRTQAVA